MSRSNISDDNLSVINEEKCPVAVSIPLDDKGPKITSKECIKQVIAACISFCAVIQVGANMSFSAILLPQLNENDSQIHITRSQASWIASIVAISLPFGSLIIGPLIDHYGRRIPCIFISIPFTIGWIFQIYATKIWHIYVSRIIAGFTGGLTTAFIVYISEISHPTLRQALLSLNSVFVSLGVLITYFFGVLLGWKLTAILMCTLAVSQSFAMFYLPESPYWCVIFKDDFSGAQRSFRWFYKNNKIYDSQYNHLMLIKTKRRNQSEELNTLQKIKSELRLFSEKAVYKPTVILMLLFFMQQITGGYVIIFYATDIFRKLDEQNRTTLNEFKCLVLLGVIRCISAIIAVFLSKSLGRRTILMISGVGMAFCSFFAGLYIYFTILPSEQLETLDTGDKTFNSAFIFVLIYIVFGSLGFLVIPWTLIGELLPVKVRGVIGGFLVSLAYIFMFIFVKIFPTILDTIDIHCIFYVLSIFNFFSVMFVYFFLPETLGKNFSQIERYFEK